MSTEETKRVVDATLGETQAKAQAASAPQTIPQAVAGKASTPQAPQAKGVFITFEGGEGVGKSTHIRFLTERLEERGYEVLRLREPGGTSIGEDLRAVVLNANNVAMADECELLVYEAARAQIVAERIRPALERGAVVLCDRFADSTVAYQAYGRGLDLDFVNQVNRFATQGVWPDRTIVMVCESAAEGLERATRRFGADRLELAGLDFHERVNQAFVDIANEDPARMRIVDSRGRKSDTAKMIFAALADLFPWMDEVLGQEAYFASLNSASVLEAARAKNLAANEANEAASEASEANEVANNEASEASEANDTNSKSNDEANKEA